MEFSLRPITPDDYTWLWQLKERTMRTYVEETWGFWDPVAQEAFFHRTFHPDLLRVIVSAGRDAGVLHLERRPLELFLANLQLHPSAQRHGLGTAVLRSLMTEARDRGLPLRLQVLKVNPAQHLYTRLGFVPTEESPFHLFLEWRPA